MYLQAQTNPPIVTSYVTEHKIKIIRELKSSAEAPIELVMGYMLKRIDDIDENRKKLRKQYPNLLPTDL